MHPLYSTFFAGAYKKHCDCRLICLRVRMNSLICGQKLLNLWCKINKLWCKLYILHHKLKNTSALSDKFFLTLRQILSYSPENSSLLVIQNNHPRRQWYVPAGVWFLFIRVVMPGLFNDHFARLELGFQTLEVLLHHVVGEIIFVHRSEVGCDGAAVALKFHVVFGVGL